MKFPWWDAWWDIPTPDGTAWESCPVGFYYWDVTIWDHLGSDGNWLGTNQKHTWNWHRTHTWHLGYTWVVFIMGDYGTYLAALWSAGLPPDLSILIISSTPCHFLHVFQIGPWLIDSVAGKFVWNIWQKWDSNLDVLSSGGGVWAIGGGLTWPMRKSSYYIHVWSRLLQLWCVLGLLRHLQALREKFIEICLHDN